MDKKALIAIAYLPIVAVLLLLLGVMWVNTIVKFPLALTYREGRRLLANGTALKIWYNDNVRMSRELIEWFLG